MPASVSVKRWQKQRRRAGKRRSQPIRPACITVYSFASLPWQKTAKPALSIMSTASIDGVVGDADFFSYCATKAAVQAMTRCAALYCGQKGLNIRVNAVAPGYILTPMAEEDARQNGQSIEEYCREFIALHPIGRLGHTRKRWPRPICILLCRFCFCHRHYADGGRRLHGAVSNEWI